ncbi:MAG: glutathione S-transferase N-terminal domain-containing protein [Gammaproteobacteria bacterium]|nr:glutathione S-transferase N-terminal domain-containing protein [Gammaproteobacteria bacterium]
MAISAARRPVMTLYSRADCPLSHRVRIVLSEKGITADVVDVDINNPPEDLIDINAYNTVPTLVDRDLVLYDSLIIMEYLDERFPHPPLMPVDPVSRARTRMMLHRIDVDWYSMIADLTGGDRDKSEKARKALRDDLTMLAPMLMKKPYFMSDEFGLIECSMGPMLWRLSHYGVEIPAQAKSVQRYAERIFKRDAFRSSLTEVEQEFVK